MKLISEFTTNELGCIIEENENGKKDYKIRGVFMQSEIKNRNGRVYPKKVLAEEVARYTKEFIKQDRAFGELGHPQGPTINLDRASHLITKLEEDGNNFVGEAKILSTPMGSIVKNLIDDGAKLGVSSRGLGSLEEKGGAQYVKNDFQLATAADIVADPSAPDAFVNGIMEGVEWIWENGILKAQKIEQYKHHVDTAKASELEEAKLRVWNDFIRSL